MHAASRPQVTCLVAQYLTQGPSVWRNSTKITNGMEILFNQPVSGSVVQLSLQNSDCVIGQMGSTTVQYYVLGIEIPISKPLGHFCLSHARYP